METYKKPVVASKNRETLILTITAKYTAAPPDNNLQKINSQTLTPRKTTSD